MPNVVLTPEEFRYMQVFHQLTGVMPIDCIVDNEHDRIIFLVKAEEVGKAIGKRGSKVRYLREAFKKNVEIVGYSDKLEEMVANALAPAKVQNVRLVKTPKGKVVYAKVDPRFKGVAIGKEGRNVSKARLILKRHFDVDSLVVV
ncbi:transcription elongation factor NusA [Ignicoccus pacificus DSM 13166]|uniref:Probable transcription termination protein NusA n=1 Tax=Ignicoccus pacificus DSM 13166 TaxID=940294 RepID=A0A977KA28_9CREN|nr:transcription elongation factor NusA [Ignicoccus pacificus DSM 13166]